MTTPTSPPKSPGRTPTPTDAATSAPGFGQPPAPAVDPTNPAVAGLHAMFPTVEIPVIEMILESVGGSQDRAIEQLLSMTDPTFQPSELHTRTEAESQLDLDAQFARSLAMQDEQDQYSRDQRREIPYQPRVRRSRPQHGQDRFSQSGGVGEYHPPQDPHQPGQNPPGMLAFEEKVNQFAEVGKQTFNSLFSKAKAKYSEFQAQHNAGVGGADRPKESSWGDESWRYGSAGTPTPGGARGGEQNRRGTWGDDTSSFSSQSSDPGPTPLSAQSASNPPVRQSARWQPSDTYDDPSPPIRVNSGTTRADTTGRKSPGVGSPDKGTAAGKIDPAKLGILPKKKVDLLSTSPPPSTPPYQNMKRDEEDGDDPNPSLPSVHRSLVEQIPKTPPATKTNNIYSLGDSDDDLEYTKNPFDEK